MGSVSIQRFNRRRGQDGADGLSITVSNLSDAPYRMAGAMKELNLPTVFVFEHPINNLSPGEGLAMEPALMQTNIVEAAFTIPSPSPEQRERNWKASLENSIWFTSTKLFSTKYFSYATIPTIPVHWIRITHPHRTPKRTVGAAPGRFRCSARGTRLLQTDGA